MADSSSPTDQDASSEDRPIAFYGTHVPRFGMNSVGEVPPGSGATSQQTNLPTPADWRDNRPVKARVANERVQAPHGTVQPGSASYAVIDREDRAFPAPEQFREVSRTRKADAKMLRNILTNDTDTPAGGSPHAPNPHGTVASNLRRNQVLIAPPSVGKSTWDLHIQRKQIAGNVTGQINLLPNDGSAPSGLQTALLANEQSPEYEVLSKLGAGSMGIVYHAKQLSLNRELAIKTLQPKADFSDHDQAMFVSEAVVTANLVHPNIVPIHDLGRTPDGKLFYSMKKVTGVAWQDVIRQRSLEENLDIFMKVCDAVAYAHSRGVINRDLKPENVVVGSYGEVVVLDWGIAVTTELFEKRKSILQDFRGGAGTPVYMAPELADPDISRVGTHSDIYLLGAILFEALEGYQPHLLKEFWGITDPYEQFDAVRTAIEQNLIEEDVTQSGELMQIARKAMSTRPEDRFSSVEALQEAIREYRITGRAEELLNSVDPSRNRGYTEYQGAVALYSEAVRKWPHNERALRGDRRARLAYAELAMRNGDIDLGLQILADQNDESFQPIIRKLKRTRLRNNLVRGTWGVTTVAALILLVALYAKNGTIADLDKKVEEKQALAFAAEQLASDAEKRASSATSEAEAQKKLASNAVKDADAKVAIAKVKEQQANDAVNAANLAKMEAEDLAKRAKEEATSKSQEAAAANKQKLEALADKEKADQATAKAEELVKRAENQRRAVEWSRYETLTSTLMDSGEYGRVIEACKEGLTAAEENTKINKRALQDRLKEAEKLVQATGNTGLKLGVSPSVAAISKDGSTIVTYSNNSVVVRRAVRNNEGDFGPVEGEFQLPIEATASKIGNVVKLSVGPTGKHILLTTPGNSHLWTLKGTGFEKVELDSETSLAMAHFTGDTNRCVLVGTRKDLTAEIWDFSGDSPRLLGRNAIGMGLKRGAEIKDSVLYPDESALLVATDELRIKECRIKSSGDGYSVQSIQDGGNLVTLFENGDSGKQITRCEKSLSLSPDGSCLALNESTSNRVFVLKAAKHNDGGTTFTAEEDRLVDTCIELRSPKKVDSIVFSADNRRVCTTHSADSVRLLLWDLQEQKYVPCEAEGLKPVKGSTRLEGAMLCGHTRNDKALESNAGLYPRIVASAFPEGDSDRLITVGEDPAVRFWRISKYKQYKDSLEVLLKDFFPPEKKQQVSEDSAMIQGTPRLDRSRRLAAVAGEYVLTQQPQSPPVEIEIKHGAPVYSVRFSADATRIVVGSSNSAAGIYDSSTGEEVPKRNELARDAFFAPAQNNLLEGHVSEITAVRFLPPHGDVLLTSDYMGSISAWDAKQDEDGIGHERARLLVDFASSEFSVSRDGKFVIAAGGRKKKNDSAAKSSDSKDPQLEHFGLVWRTDDILKTFVPSPFLRLENQYADQVITAVAISPSSTRFATGGRRGRIVVWDATGNKIASIEKQHRRDQVSGIAFIDDDQFVTTGYDGTVILWKIVDKKLQGQQLKGVQANQSKAPEYIIKLRMSPDGRHFTTSEVSRVRDSQKNKLMLIIRVWDLAANVQVPEKALDESQKEVRESGKVSHVVLERELTTEDVDGMHDVAWSSDGKELLITQDGDDNEVFRLLDASTWKPVLVRKMKESYVRPTRAVLRPKFDGSEVTAASFDGRFTQLWNLKSGEALAEFRSHALYRLAASFSPDRRFVATASEVLRIFDANESSTPEEPGSGFGQSIFRQQVDTNPWIPLADVVYSPVPGDARIAAVDLRGTLFYWKFNEETRVVEKTGEFKFDASDPSALESDAVKGNAVAWSPDGKMLACIQQGTAVLRFTSGDERPPVHLPLEPETKCLFNCLTFANVNGKLLIAAGGIASSQAGAPDAYWALWTVENGTPTLTGTATGQHLEEPASNEALRNKSTLRQAGITAIAIDARNEDVITGGTDGRVLKWILPESTDEPAEVRRYQFSTEKKHLLPDKPGRIAHESAMVTSMDMKADGRLVTADSTGLIFLWPAE